MSKLWLSLIFIVFLAGCQQKTATPLSANSEDCLSDTQCAEVAEQGNAIEWVDAGIRYAAGDGVPVDYKKALYLYQKAADKGVPEAQYNVGMMYFTGQGVPQDYQQAYGWFIKAANSPKEMSPARLALGTMYFDGHGVEKDYVQAITWFKKAGKNSRDYRDASAKAFLFLGQIYYHGIGMTKDNQTAFAWFYFSTRLGNQEGKRSFVIIQSKLSKTQLTRAKRITNQLNQEYHVVLDAPFPEVTENNQ